MVSSGSGSQHHRRSGGLATLIFDPKFRALAFQTLTLLLLALLIWDIVSNTLTNLAAQKKQSGFDFLSRTAGFQIIDTPGTYLMGFEAGVTTYGGVFMIGLINTLVVAAIGIFFATLLGFLLGVMRLSKNVVINSFATVYIEVFRNIPLLLHLFIWYFMVLRLLPPKSEPLTAFGYSIGISIHGFYGPIPTFGSGSWVVGLALLLGVIGAVVMSRWARKRQERTGQQFPRFWVGLALIIGLPALAQLLAGMPVGIEFPEFKADGPIFRRGFQDGVGMVLKPELVAVALALTLYTAAFIAEIVRAGILAVAHGQTEAAHALGLRAGSTLQLVIIPQAMRVIIPPLTSQFLNITKNSSLSVAIAYPDLVSVFGGTTLNQTGREIEIIFIIMMVYLSISLLTSAFMNWFNSRMKLVER